VAVHNRTRITRPSLYTRVFLVNAAILMTAVGLVAFTPFSISPNTTNQQLAVLGVGLLVSLAANAVLLRLSLRPLRDLKDRMMTVDILHLDERLDPSGTPEIASVIRVFNAAIDRLEEERRSSMRRILTAQETERSRVANELHDEIGQKLTAVVLELGHVLERVPDDAATIADAQELARESLDQLSMISHELRPPMLDDLGLVSALAALCASMTRRTSIDVAFTPRGVIPALDADAELVAYRVAQEAVTNAARHGQCSVISVTLDADADQLTLRVRDNGVGLHQHHAGSGMRGMRERALMIGGQLTVASPSDGGVAITLRIPTITPSEPRPAMLQ